MTEPSPKRRKVRKGTKNCWVCRRRKIKCTFSLPDATACDGCRSRGCECRSQEEYEVRDVEQLAQDTRNQGTIDTCAEANRPPSQRSITNLQSDSFYDSDTFSRAVRQHWPTSKDADLLLSVRMSTTILTHGTLCIPYAKCFSRPLERPSEVLAPMPQSHHPVLQARRCLMLAIYLQGIPSSAGTKLKCMSIDHKRLMSKMFEIAIRCVTSNDELLHQLEGIECLMLESMYLNNSGKLRRAWLVNRKAISVAQMLGVGDGKKASNMVLEPETWDRVDPVYMWRRLVATDRYLSSMLGLPIATMLNTGTDWSIDEPSEWDQMDAYQLLAADRLFSVTSTLTYNAADAQIVDDMLHTAAAKMPPKWWSAPPNLKTICKNDIEGLKETLRLMMQFSQYYMLVRVHLPFLLRKPDIESCYEYNKLAAADASRASLSLYVALRSNDLGPAYCRGIDFIAFIAGVTLSLAHMAVQKQEAGMLDRSGVSALQSLRNRRLVDRGLLEATLEIMESMARTRDDAVAQQIARFLKALLEIEQVSATGELHESSLEPKTDDSVVEGLSGTIDGAGGMQINIPHIGAVNIQRSLQDVVNKANNWCDDSGVVDQMAGFAGDGDAGFGGGFNADELALQGVDFALFDGLGIDWRQ